jgi:hypothetical protein
MIFSSVYKKHNHCYDSRRESARSFSDTWRYEPLSTDLEEKLRKPKNGKAVIVRGGITVVTISTSNMDAHVRIYTGTPCILSFFVVFFSHSKVMWRKCLK